MSQTLILELSDEVYTTIQRQAESAGTSPAHWLATTWSSSMGLDTCGKHTAATYRSRAARRTGPL